MCSLAGGRKTLGANIPFCLVVTLTGLSLAHAQSTPPAWTWEFVSSHVPKFEEKGKENQRMLVVEILFHNNQEKEQRLSVAQEEFQASTPKGKPVEVRGLLFRMMNPEGAKSMAYKGGMKRMETLDDREGNPAGLFFDSPGPVKVIVEGGKTYKQRLLLTRPKGKRPLRLKFDDLPELEIALPR